MLTLESRRAAEIQSLIATYGGRAIVAPALREAPLESDDQSVALGRAIADGQFDAVIFLTGVGLRALLESVTHAGFDTAFLAGLSQTRVMARGPKPLAVLRELQVPVWASAPEPNTWREVIAAIDASRADWSLDGARIAVQEYGASNPALLDALRDRGASVRAVATYRWEMPDDVGPLREAARLAAASEIDVVLITSGVQFVHFWRVVEEMKLETPVRAGLACAAFASIGPTASAEIRRHGFEPALEASRPRMGQLVREAAGLP